MGSPTFHELGKLELGKCALYTIQRMFSEDGIAKLKKPLIIKSQQIGKEHEIKLLNNDKYFQSLGITSSPNGDQSK